MGVYVGLSRITLDINAIELGNENDPALANLLASQFKPDFGIGVWYYDARFFAGASVQQLTPLR